MVHKYPFLSFPFLGLGSPISNGHSGEGSERSRKTIQENRVYTRKWILKLFAFLFSWQPRRKIPLTKLLNTGIYIFLKAHCFRKPDNLNWSRGLASPHPQDVFPGMYFSRPNICSPLLQDLKPWPVCHIDVSLSCIYSLFTSGSHRILFMTAYSICHPKRAETVPI